ncbi:hypothetical protein D3C80_329650 [compost metagenome]
MPTHQQPNLIEKITQFIFIFCGIGFILTLSGLLAYSAYAVIPSSPFRELAAIIIVLMVLTLLFAILSFWTSRKRIKNIWKTVEANFNQHESVSKTDYLIKRIAFSLEEFNASTKWMYRNVRLYKYSTVVLSGLATVILGLNFSYFFSERTIYLSVTKDIALVLNTVVTALATLSIFWNVDKYWIQNKIIKHQLRQLKSSIEFERSENRELTDEQLKSYFNKHQRILREFHLYWEGVMTEKDNGDKDH